MTLGTITVEDLGKRFRRYGSDRPATLQEAVLRGSLLRGLRAEDHFWALRHLSFHLNRGGMLGVVGANGAGKSTLLHLLGGVLQPDEGRVRVQGKIGALFDLGVGFHPDLTGRENVMVSGVIAGLTRREVLGRFDELVRFAELEPFIDHPLRTYSTGMRMRLGFAVAAFTDPDVLLVDEVLAVGDLAFQAKCFERIAEFRKRGMTIVLVSHDAALVREICDEVLWLRSGEQMAYGQARAVMDRYVDAMRSETRQRTPREFVPQVAANGVELRANENRFGSFEMQITSVRLFDRDGRWLTEIASGRPLRVEIEYSAPQPITAPIFGVTILQNESGLVCIDASTATSGLSLPVVQGKGLVELVVERVDLAGGSYWVDVGVYHHDWSYAYDYHSRIYAMCVRSMSQGNGIMHPPVRWQMRC